MASNSRSYNRETISLGQDPFGREKKGEIQLTGRQLELLKTRRKAKEAGLQTSLMIRNQQMGRNPPSKPKQDAPSRSWSDDATEPVTWSESASSASAVSRGSSRISSSVVSAAMSRAASRVSSRSEKSAVSFASSTYRANQAKQFYGQKLYDDSGASYHGSRSEATSLITPRGMQSINTAQTSQVFTKEDEQKAFLRKMMKSYTPKPSQSIDRTKETTTSLVSSTTQGSKKITWASRKGKSLSRVSSSTSASDKAIMRKVLERARNKKQGLLSSKPKKVGSPKKDKSRFSIGKFKKDTHSPRFSSRNSKRFFGNNESNIVVAKRSSDDDHESPFDEGPTKSLNLNEKADATKRKLYDDSGESVMSGSSGPDGTNTIKKEGPTHILSKLRKEQINNLDELMLIRRKKYFESKSTIRSVPEVSDDGEIEIKLSDSYDGVTSEISQGSNAIQTSAEPEGYRDFLQTLKAEVSGSHSQLWDSFHSLFRGDNRIVRPLSFRKYGGAFDERTKEAVAAMSTHLKEEYGAESEAGTQLANDRAVKAGSYIGKQQALKQSSVLSQNTRTKPTGKSASLSSSRSNHPTQFGVNLRKSLGEQTGQAVANVGSEPEHSASEPSSFTSAKPHIETDTESIPSKNVSTFAHKDQPTISDVSNAGSSKRNFQIPKSKPVRIESPKSESSAPWQSVKLRSVDPKSESESRLNAVKLHPSVNSSRSDTASATSSIPTSWAKVKLRKVSVNDDDSRPTTAFTPKTADSSESGEIHHFVVRRPTPEKELEAEVQNDIPMKRTNSVQTSISSDPAEGSKFASVAELFRDSRSAEKKDLSIKESTSDEWELAAVSSSVSEDSTMEGTTMVPLVPGPESKSFFGLKVVVGKKGIMKIDFPANLSQANVIWRLELDELKSAMLDMSAFKVKLFQINGEHKDLAFESSEHCMKFANAFHEVANGNDDDDDKTDDDKSKHSDRAVFVEQLSEEEQRVLEEFRKKKRMPPVGDQNNEEVRKSDEPSSSLSNEESKIIESYKKMLKMHVPEGAVRHKMERDKVDPKLMLLVLGDENDTSPAPALVPPKPTNSASNSLTIAEQAAAAPYKRMLKMMVPAEGVRHKMEKDGVDPKIILAVLGGNGSDKEKDSSNTIAALTVVEEAAAASYKKMLKMHIPKEAVEHKMKKDGVSIKIMENVLGVTMTKTASGVKSKSLLSDEEESIASAFRKMLRLKISKETVRHKMQTEGISEKIMASVLGETYAKGSKNPRTPQRRVKGGFHWSPLSSEENLRKSVWGKTTIMRDSKELDVANDISKHVEQFKKKEEIESGKSKSLVKASGPEQKDMAKLIDLNRANNVAITLKAFNDFQQDELAKIIEFVDPHGKINGDRALFMRDLLPVPAEVKAIKNYKGDDDRLVSAEIWFQKIVHIKRIEEKIQVMRAVETFKLEVQAVVESFEMLVQVCNQVMNSERLPDLLEMVRQIGNRMNDGRGEEAAGFKLEFLSRLSQTKGSDKKTTALDLVVMIFLTRNQREALSLLSDFPQCQEASKIQIKDLNADVKRLGGILQKCKKEKDLLMRDGNISRFGKATVRSDASSQNKSGPGSAFMEARGNFLAGILAAGGNNAAPKPFAQPPKQPSPKASGLKPVSRYGNDEYNIKSSVDRLEEFLKEANEGFEKLKEANEEAIKTCRELSAFFCEKGGEKATSSLLSVLAEFASNLDRVVKKHESQEKRREKRQMSAKLKKAQKTKSLKGSGQSARSPTSSSAVSTTSTEESIGGKSLVLMVNQMLKIAGDKMKEDYANGVTYNNPDSRLKSIYAKEKSRDNPEKVGSPRGDIFGKIASRRLSSENNAQVGLSELVKKIESRSRKAQPGKFDGLPRSPVRGKPTTKFPFSESSNLQANKGRDSGESFATALSNFQKNGFESEPQRQNLSNNRWTRKIEEDQVSDSAGSGTSLSSFSSASSDLKIQEMQRQKLISRWASNSNIKEANSKDLEEGSDIGFSSTTVSETRQRYLNRWATRPTDEELM